MMPSKGYGRVLHSTRQTFIPWKVAMNSRKYIIQPNQKKDIINLISQHIEKFRHEIIFAYVFGSFIARNSFSDIDIAVMAREHIENPLDFEIILENEMEGVVRFRTDIRLLNRAPLAFSHSVIRTGRLIVDRDSNVRADFENRILKQYFDFSYCIREYLGEVLHAPV